MRLTLLLSGFVLLLLAGCEYNTQTSSGKPYLKQYRSAPSSPATSQNRANNLKQPSSIEEEVRAVAAAEPTLRFPAKIGLARIHNGRLSHIPLDEKTEWVSAAKQLGPEFGTFVAINPLIAELVSNRTDGHSCGSDNRQCYATNRLQSTLRKIRWGAARQHVAAVLIYETYNQSSQKMNVLSALNLTIVGAFVLPGESINVRGYASALLVDVRNGYPYGTVNKSLQTDTITPNYGSNDIRRSEEEKIKTAAALA